MIDALRTHLEANRAAFGLAEGVALRVELRAPWRESRLSRCHAFVRQAGEAAPRLVVTDAMPLYAPAAPLAPPPFVSPFMPPGGMFTLDGTVYAWSRYVDAPSLLASLGDAPNQEALALVARFAATLAAATAREAVQTPLPLAALAEQCLSRIGAAKAVARFRVLADQASRLADPDASGPCSWSHGDLWPADVFVGKDGFTLVDWEWATPAAPLGVDLIDLHVTLMEHWLGVPTLAAWQSLLSPPAGIAAPARAAFEALAAGRDRRHAVLYALVRAAGRVLAQDGPAGLPLIRVYEAVLTGLKHGE
ncbi:MAG: hypothetical protein AB7D37_14830 [Desulfovibrio sp.]